MNTRATSVLAMLLALCAIAGTATAATRGHATRKQAPAKPIVTPAAKTPAIVDGLRAFIDPETGRISGAISDLKAPADLATRPDLTNRATVTLPDGSVMIDTSDLLDYYTITIDALGLRTFGCSDEPAAPAPKLLPRALSVKPAVRPQPQLMLPYADR